MRNKKPMNNNYGHKRRFDGGHRHHQGGNNNRGPRKNWPQLREKYVAQARDAMASGDRVLAENYLQHADHCWRMMMEENQNRPRPQVSSQPNDAAPVETAQEDDPMSGNSHALPSFITTPYGQPQQTQPVDPATVQNWEERDTE
jgi:hypothetical protein